MPLMTRKFTAQEYHLMAEVGILTPEDKVELIQGEIITMSPVGLKHAATIKRFNSLLTYQLQNQAIIGVQDPIQLDNLSEPQPDISLLKMRSDFYESSIPTAQDILALIEVSDSTIKYDLEVKLPLYGSNNIPEIWLVNLNDQSLTIYRNPEKGYYQNQQILGSHQTASFLAFPQLIVKLRDFLK